MKSTGSPCIYCGCGCRLNYLVKDNKINNILPIKLDIVSEGMPCIKGLLIKEVFDKNRITKPLIKINGRYTKTTLAKALSFIYKNTKELPPNQVFFNTSGKITNENNFVIQKFARICYKTPNIDSCCARLCHNATVMAMNNVFGTPNLTDTQKIKNTDCLMIIGSEPENDYPVFYNKLIKNKTKTIIINHLIKEPVNNGISITIKQGTETCLLNGIINELIKKGIKSSAEGFSILKTITKSYDEKYTCETCQIKIKNYKKIINEIYNSKTFGVFHGMGLTQNTNSIENVHSLLNLVLLKKGDIFSLRGEINVQGAGDMGGMPGILPTGDLSTTAELEKEWGDIPEYKGRNLIEAFFINPVKAVFITEFNPLKSMPDIKRLKKSLSKTFIVYFGSYFNETAKSADVVIPISALFESEGTITTGERRIRKVNRVIKGQKEIWQVLSKLSKNFGKSRYFKYKNSREIFSEIKKFVPDYSRLDINKIWKGEGEFAVKNKKFERFMPEKFEGRDEITDKEYSFLLTTFRSKNAFLGNETTGQSRTLNVITEKPGFYMNNLDMKRLKIKEGDEIIITSRINSIKSRAYSLSKIPRRMIGAYIHNTEVNKLIPLVFDEESFTPNYKGIAVKVEKI